MERTSYFGIAFIGATLIHLSYGGGFTPGTYIAIILAVVFLGIEPVQKIRRKKKRIDV